MAEQDSDEKKQASVSEYLQAPRKKRKNYVIMATGPKVDGLLANEIEEFVRNRYKSLAVSTPRNARELTRQFGRNITLLIISDHFCSTVEESLHLVKQLKVRRQKEAIPVLFLTDQPDALIEAYQKEMAAYHEIDDFCNIDSLTPKQVLNRVAVGVDRKNARKSRRYKTNFDVQFYHLSKDSNFKGKITDISVHGALLESKDVGTFKLGDQLKISIPFQKYVGAEHGEFLRLAAKVRRVYISGDLTGISFEHMEERQQLLLNDFVTSFVNDQFASTAG